MTLPMTLSPSAHVDTFCRDNLPPREHWPELVFDLPELQYPDRLNCAVELLDATIDRLGADRPCLLAPDGERWTYGELRGDGQPDRPRAGRRARRRAGQPGAAARPEQPVAGRLLVRRAARPARSWSRRCRCCAPASSARSPRSPGSTSRCATTGSLDDLRRRRRPATARSSRTAATATTTCAAARDAARTTSTPVDTAADDVALLAFTSGTTGRPKATMHFHRDVLADRRHVLRARAASRPPTTCSPARRRWRSPSASAGCVVFPLRVGASTLLIEKADAGRARRRSSPSTA